MGEDERLSLSGFRQRSSSVASVASDGGEGEGGQLGDHSTVGGEETMEIIRESAKYYLGKMGGLEGWEALVDDLVD